MVYYNKQYNVYCELCKTVTKNPPIYLSFCFSLYFSKLDSSSVKKMQKFENVKLRKSESVFDYHCMGHSAVFLPNGRKAKGPKEGQLRPLSQMLGPMYTEFLWNIFEKEIY